MKETIVAGAAFLASACGIKPAETEVHSAQDMKDTAAETTTSATSAPQDARDEKAAPTPVSLSGHEMDYVIGKTDGSGKLTFTTQVGDLVEGAMGTVTHTEAIEADKAGNIAVYNSTTQELTVYTPDKLEGGLAFTQGGSVGAEALAALPQGGGKDIIGTLPLPEHIQAKLDALENAREAAAAQLANDPKAGTYLDEHGNRVSPDERPFTERVEASKEENGRSR